MIALSTLCTVPSQAQKFEPSSQKEITTLLEQNSQHEIVEIHELTRVHDDLELAPGRYIKTEWYASNLYFLEGSDVFFLHQKDVPYLMKENQKGSQTMNIQMQLNERSLNIPQTIRYIMVPAAWAMRWTSDPNLETKLQILTDSLTNKSQELGQGIGPSYNYLKCDNVTNINDIDNSLYVPGNYYQTMQNILDYKYNNDNKELWAVYRTNSEFPGGIAGNSIYSQGNNLIGTTSAAYGVKWAGAPNNMNAQISVSEHEVVHLQGTAFADYSAHKASPTNLMQPVISATNIHPETRANTSGMGRQENGDNGAQSSCEVLPLELLSFTGEKLKNGNNQLTWSVAQEVNVAKYEIEYSEDGKSRQEIGTVSASNKAGKHNYSFEDISKRKHRSYYRLIMWDQNSDRSISHIVSIQWSEESSALEYAPNPTKGDLKLILEGNPKGLVKAKVYNILGQQMMEVNIQVGETLELPQEKGIYIIQSEDPYAKHYTQKVVKN